MVKSFLSSEYEVFVEQCAIFTLQTPGCIIWLKNERCSSGYVWIIWKEYVDVKWQTGTVCEHDTKSFPLQEWLWIWKKVKALFTHWDVENMDKKKFFVLWNDNVNKRSESTSYVVKCEMKCE